MKSRKFYQRKIRALRRILFPRGAALLALVIALGILAGPADARKKHRRHKSHHTPRHAANCLKQSPQAVEEEIRRVHQAMLAEAIERGECVKGFPTADLTVAVARCESGFDNCVIGDGGSSWGALQIQPKHHPLDRKECTNVELATRYFIAQVRAGNGRAWTCYKKVTRSGKRGPR